MSSSNPQPTASCKARREQNIRLIRSREESRDGRESWEIRVFVGKDGDGKKRYASRTVRGGIREARKARADLVAQVANGTYRSRKQIQAAAEAKKAEAVRKAEEVLTVADLFEKWLSDIDRPSVAATTYRRHCQIVRNDIIPNLGDLRLDEIGPLDIQEYYTKARESGRKDGDGGLSERTMLHIHRLMKQVFKQGIAWRMMSYNPCDGVKSPSPGKPDMQILTASQLAQLLEASKRSKYRIPILLAAMTGMRRGEICGLHWDQVDFVRSTITVLHSLEESGPKLALKEPKNESSRRTIEIDAGTMEILKEHKREQDERWKKLEATPARRLVCADMDGGFIRPKNLSTAFRAIIVNSKLPRIRFHDLRHTHASLLIDAGVSIIQVSARLGHSNVTTTLNTYGHKIPHSGREAATTFARMINPDAGSEADGT